jgi:integrase
MALITDRGMQANSAAADQWLREQFGRGNGTLEGRITPSGNRLFYFRYSDPTGKQARYSIGRFDPKGDGRVAYTTKQARDKAKQLSALYRAGHKDLAEYIQREVQRAEDLVDLALRERQAEETERDHRMREAEEARARRVTVLKLFDEWKLTELRPQRQADNTRTGRKDGGRYVEDQFRRHVFPSIGTLAVEDLKRSDLLSIIDHLRSRGISRTAQIVFSDLNQMLNFAVDREIINANPLATVKRKKVAGSTTSRARFLSEQELKLLPNAMTKARINPRIEALIWIILATGARIGEIAGAVWAASLPSAPVERARVLDALAQRAGTVSAFVGWVDIATRTWHIPTTKNQRSHTIFLSDFALAQFDKLSELKVLSNHEDSTYAPWIFPSEGRQAPVNPKSITKQIAARQTNRPPIAHRSKLTDSLVLPDGKWTPHDLRRTCATTMARLGVQQEVINECLNHVQQDRMSRVYIKGRREQEQANAFSLLGDYLKAIAHESRQSK